VAAQTVRAVKLKNVGLFELNRTYFVTTTFNRLVLRHHFFSDRVINNWNSLDAVAAGRGGQEGAIAPGRRRRGGATAAPGEGAFLGEGDFVAML